MRRPPPLPIVPEPFPAAFRALLPALLRGRGDLDAGRIERLRSRRAVLSQSGTFVGHRRYVRGDDLRRLDWAAYARTGELFTKQLQDDDRRAATIWLDLSASLLAGTPSRRGGALQLAAVIAALGLQRLDGVTVVAPGATPATVRFTGTAQLPQLLDHLQRLPVAAPPADQGAAEVLRQEALGSVHWISDFARPQDCALPLSALRRRGARVTGWLPRIADDESPPSSGYLRLCDPESGEELAIPVDAALCAELQRQLESLARQQRALFAETGCQLHHWSVPSPATLRLADFLPIVAAVSR